MTNMGLLRKELAAAFPGMKFKLKTVSFEGLGYGKGVFVLTADGWPARMYDEVKVIVEKHGAILSGYDY